MAGIEVACIILCVPVHYLCLGERWAEALSEKLFRLHSVVGFLKQAQHPDITSLVSVCACTSVCSSYILMWCQFAFVLK